MWVAGVVGNWSLPHWPCCCWSCQSCQLLLLLHYLNFLDVYLLFFTLRNSWIFVNFRQIFDEHYDKLLMRNWRQLVNIIFKNDWLKLHGHFGPKFGSFWPSYHIIMFTFTGYFVIASWSETFPKELKFFQRNWNFCNLEPCLSHHTYSQSLDQVFFSLAVTGTMARLDFQGSVPEVMSKVIFHCKLVWNFSKGIESFVIWKHAFDISHITSSQSLDQVFFLWLWQEQFLD